MEKQIKNNIDSQKEKMIEETLRTGGYLFPETVSEVKEFEKLFGTTNVSLPEDLKTPDFIDKNQVKKSIRSKVPVSKNDNFAVAARDGAPTLPKEILDRMEADRKKA